MLAANRQFELSVEPIWPVSTGNFAGPLGLEIGEGRQGIYILAKIVPGPRLLQNLKVRLRRAKKLTSPDTSQKAS